MNIVKEIMAVKSDYMGFNWSITEENTPQVYFKRNFDKMIFEANQNGKEVNSRTFGNLIGSNDPVISDTQLDGYIPLDNGMFIADAEPWKMIITIIQAHRKLFDNPRIALKIKVNLSAIEFYRNTNGDGFCTSDPQLELAVSSYANHIASKVKN